MLLLCFICVGSCGEFVDSLDEAWNAHDYDKCNAIIEYELQRNSNTCAKVAKALYYAYVECDLEAAIYAMPDKFHEPETKSKKDVTAADLVDMFRAALTVPMEERPSEKQLEYTRRYLFPTNYPERAMLIMLENEKANHGLESTSAPPAAGTLETHP